MPSSLVVMLVAAVLAAAAGAWVLRAHRRAGGAAARRALAASALGAVAALGLYLVLGRPELPDAPYAARMAALEHRDPTSFTVDEALAVLHESARAHPRDARPYLYTGDILLRAGRADEAARAYDAALRRAPQSGEAMVGLGRAMVAVDQGRVSEEALRLFQSAAVAAPRDPTPWLYQAMAAMESGRVEDARRFQSEALSRMAPDDPARAMAAQMSAGR